MPADRQTGKQTNRKLYRHADHNTLQHKYPITP